MTYDLHGQWDYDNKWTSPGCPTGNCLRSHVNETETKDALSMITKAGIPSNKVVVGVTSYGRSFKMEKAGCTGPMCKFTGNPRISNAAKGRCTDTAGYISNAEIVEIINSGKVTKQWKGVGSNFLVYDNTEWVAYMDDNMKAARSKFYDSYNFAGTTDWAVDLQDFIDGTGGNEYPDDYEPYIDPNFYPPCTGKFTSLVQLELLRIPLVGNMIPAHCMEKYIADVEVAIMEAALKKYKDLVNNGYDDKFNIYEKYVTEQVPVQINAFMASGKADDYFKCTETKWMTCCGNCHYFCDLDCDNTCEKDHWGTRDIECPTIISSDIFSSDDLSNATYTLEDAEGFWTYIGEEYSIEKSWVRFGKHMVRISNGCQYAGEDVNGCIDRTANWYYNYPQRGDVKVPNPKDLIGDAYKKTKDLLARIKIVRDNADYDSFMEWPDVVDASSLPALTVQEAVANMDAIIEIAKEIEKAQREEFIMNFLMGLLFFIPVVGEIGAGLATVRSLMRLTGAIGEAGMMLYEVVSDPSNAFMSIFSALAGAGVGRNGFRNEADARRSMTSTELNGLGTVKKDLDRIENLRGSVCKR